MTIGERIKRRRKELHISADELGMRLGKDRSTIYRYEKGDIENLPLDILEPIAAALQTTPQSLMGWVSEETQQKNGTIASAVIRMQNDDVFFSIVERLSKLDADKLKSVDSLLSAFSTTEK